jgi:hypothetical protein
MRPNRSTTPPADRFWPKVNKSGPVPAHVPHLGPCWIWLGAIDPAFGYGKFGMGGRGYSPWNTHRAAWFLTFGEIPAGMNVLHKCDNPPCVNPAHLFLGTFQDNTRDMFAKGRGAVGDRHPARSRGDYLPRGDEHPARLRGDYLPRGEAHVNAKLTADDVREIRRRYAEGGVAYKQLAEAFAVTASVIGLIVRRKSWRHV